MSVLISISNRLHFSVKKTNNFSNLEYNRFVFFRLCLSFLAYSNALFHWFVDILVNITMSIKEINWIYEIAFRLSMHFYVVNQIVFINGHCVWYGSVLNNVQSLITPNCTLNRCNVNDATMLKNWLAFPWLVGWLQYVVCWNGLVWWCVDWSTELSNSPRIDFGRL